MKAAIEYAIIRCIRYFYYTISLPQSVLTKRRGLTEEEEEKTMKKLRFLFLLLILLVVITALPSCGNAETPGTERDPIIRLSENIWELHFTEDTFLYVGSTYPGSCNLWNEFELAVEEYNQRHFIPTGDEIIQLNYHTQVGTVVYEFIFADGIVFCERSENFPDESDIEEVKKIWDKYKKLEKTKAETNAETATKADY